MKRVNEAGLRLFAPERGGTYEVSDKRPKPLDMVDYRAGDVVSLLNLMEGYQRRTSASCKDRVEREGAPRFCWQGARSLMLRAG